MSAKPTPEDRKRWRETFKARHSDYAAKCREYQRRHREKLKQPNWRKRQKTRLEIERDSRLRVAERKAGRPRPQHCELCGDFPALGASLCFDHCHKTGKFRGWLCNRCNRTLGLLKDDPELVLKLALYLEQHRGDAT